MTEEKYRCPRCDKKFRTLKYCKEHFELWKHTGNYNNPLYEWESSHKGCKE